MDSLADALESFNRKERNLLVRAILGHKEKLLKLSDDFRKQVSEKLELPPIPDSAWWGTDYHLSWLAGALAIFLKDSPNLTEVTWPNSCVNGRKIVEGNQEDIDLIVVDRLNLILVEAKAYGAWSNSQLRHKLDRLRMVYDFYERLTDSGSRTVKFHFLITSPNPPKNLNVDWPDWAWRNEQIPWIPLQIDKSKPIYAVTRCAEQGEIITEGGFWKIVNVHPGDRNE